MTGELQAWQLVVAGASIVLALAAVNLGFFKWLLDRHDSLAQANATKLADNGAKIAEIEREILRLRADLPLEYVRREDWIRFGNTLEAKIDTIRAEVREQLTELRHDRLQSLKDNSL